MPPTRRWPRYLGDLSLFRVHDPPDPAKMEAFRAFCKTLGFDLPKQANRDPRVLRDFLDEVRKTELAPMVQLMLLRSLKQARYAGANRGHYGLASEWYTHFTSPIRRYPDLMVHRLLAEHLKKKRRPTLPDPVELEAGGPPSDQAGAPGHRGRAGDAVPHAGALPGPPGGRGPFTASSPGLTPFGFFVSLEEIFADGLVRLVDLPNDYYKYEESHQRLLGRRHREQFPVGGHRPGEGGPRGHQKAPRQPDPGRGGGNRGGGVKLV